MKTGDCKREALSYSTILLFFISAIPYRNVLNLTPYLMTSNTLWLFCEMSMCVWGSGVSVYAICMDSKLKNMSIM